MLFSAKDLLKARVKGGKLWFALPQIQRHALSVGSLVCVQMSLKILPQVQTGMTGRPGRRTMEMNGRSAVWYLLCTPYAPFFMLTCLFLSGSKGAFELAGATWDRFQWNLRPVMLGVGSSRCHPMPSLTKPPFPIFRSFRLISR